MDELVLQIRGQIARYLSGEIDVPALRRWLLPVTWQVERAASKEAAEFARTVELLLEEFVHEDWNEDELQSHLRGVLGVVGEFGCLQSLTGSTAETTVVEVPTLGDAGFTAEWRPVGTRSEMAFA
jgi:hypothetical protein